MGAEHAGVARTKALNIFNGVETNAQCTKGKNFQRDSFGHWEHFLRYRHIISSKSFFNVALKCDVPLLSRIKSWGIGRRSNNFWTANLRPKTSVITGSCVHIQLAYDCLQFLTPNLQNICPMSKVLNIFDTRFSYRINRRTQPVQAVNYFQFYELPTFDTELQITVFVPVLSVSKYCFAQSVCAGGSNCGQELFFKTRLLFIAV